jgi:CubicO group peptidase (beta-lactamase class C family)
LTVHRADAPVDVGPPRQRCVLGLRGLQPNRVVRPEEIIDVLWGAHPQATSRNMVHAYVSRLRRLLPPWKGITLITRGDGGYRLTVDSGQLDLLRFDEFVARAVADPGSALDLYAQALACWRGPVLADLTARLRRQIVSEEHLRLMTSDQVPAIAKTPDSFFPGFWDGTGWGFGVGVDTEGGRAGRYGWSGGLGTNFFVDPDGTVGVLLTQVEMGERMQILLAEFQALPEAA